MRGVPNDGLRVESVRLRVEERLSLREIQARTGASKSSLSAWLVEHPLTEEERVSKHQAAVSQPRPGRRKPKGSDSKYMKMTDGRELSRAQKGQIAEAAVLFRLSLLGLPVMTGVFDGAGTDWVVQVPSGALRKVQVKWASQKEQGLPVISLVCSNGRAKQRRYREDEYDFLVGYDLHTDIAYVFTWSETESHQTALTIREDAAERWDKITGA